MASISREPNGHKTIQFVADDNTRKSIRIGKVSMKQAEAVRVRVERIIAAKLTGHITDDDTVRWLAGLDNSLLDKLAAVGLIEPHEETQLAAFLDNYIAKRKLKKSNTIRNYERTKNLLVGFFGERKFIQELTPGDADEWRNHLLERYAPTTVSREVKRAKQFFRAAVRKKLLNENPFADLPTPAQVNDAREFFITKEISDDVLDACPDAEWRLIFALARYGGLRVPSEVLRLRWVDVDWVRERITVYAAKTEHHQDGGIRQIPLFTELRPHLEEALKLAEEGVPHVITRYRRTNANLRTQIHRIIRRAGHDPWPKVFQNLRATRETELFETYPSHVVTKWIGNSEQTARKHYLQVTDEHYRSAARGGAESGALDVRSVQISVQQDATQSGRVSGQTQETPAKTGVSGDGAAPCITVPDLSVPPTGVEPVSPD